jgi:hypothetical protein
MSSLQMASTTSTIAWFYSFDWQALNHAGSWLNVSVVHRIMLVQIVLSQYSFNDCSFFCCLALLRIDHRVHDAHMMALRMLLLKERLND